MRMKRFLYLSLAALMVLAVSCKKDNKPGNDDPGKYGVDGVTPMPDAVDIGLVIDGQKVLWANFNLGASKESEKGDYYAWGETEIHYSSLDPLTWKEGMENGYSSTTYKYAKGTTTSYTKYCNKAEMGDGGFTDGLITLLPEDDVVCKRLGGKWRLPSLKDFQGLVELKNDPATQ